MLSSVPAPFCLYGVHAACRSPVSDSSILYPFFFVNIFHVPCHSAEDTCFFKTTITDQYGYSRPIFVWQTSFCLTTSSFQAGFCPVGCSPLCFRLANVLLIVRVLFTAFIKHRIRTQQSAVVCQKPIGLPDSATKDRKQTIKTENTRSNTRNTIDRNNDFFIICSSHRLFHAVSNNSQISPA